MAIERPKKVTKITKSKMGRIHTHLYQFNVSVGFDNEVDRSLLLAEVYEALNRATKEDFGKAFVTLNIEVLQENEVSIETKCRELVTRIALSEHGDDRIEKQLKDVKFLAKSILGVC